MNCVLVTTDPPAVLREQAKRLFEALVKPADPRTFALLNPLLALLVEASGKRA